MLSPKQAAERLGLSPARVRALIKAGALRATNIGIDRPVWAIAEDELARFAALDRPSHRPTRKDRTMSQGFTVEQIAGRIYDRVLTMLAYTEIDTLAEARKINSGDGWTIEESLDNKIRGNVMRYEGVRVSDEKLVAAHTLALEWLHAKD
jgi:excisionase family DNA binding protein